MKKRKEYAIIFTVGGLFYSLLEILWRGYTHWTMVICGGGCFLSVYLIHNKCSGTNIFRRSFRCSAVITAAEFAVGCIVNIALKWKVWDYSAMRFNLLGQVCLAFSCLWFLLSIPAAPLCRILNEILRAKESRTFKESTATGRAYGAKAKK